MSQTQEKKSRFQVSREVQEEFVNGIAEAMLALTSKAAGKPHVADTPTGTPFCPTSGREYGGPNMLRLMLAGMEKGYSDDRWLTFQAGAAIPERASESESRHQKGRTRRQAPATRRSLFHHRGRQKVDIPLSGGSKSH